MRASRRLIRRVLVVEDEPALRREIGRLLRSTGRDVVEADTVASARSKLVLGCDLVMVDVRLPDGSGVDVAEAAAMLTPAPLMMVLTGGATAQEGFALCELGALRFFSKPFSPEELLEAIETVTPPRIQLEAMLKTLVGRKDLRAVEHDVRHTMVSEALAVTGGNMTEAAKLLNIARQVLQHIVRLGRRTTNS